MWPFCLIAQKVHDTVGNSQNIGVHVMRMWLCMCGSQAYNILAISYGMLI